MRGWWAILMLASLAAADGPQLLLYLPFDGSPSPAVGNAGAAVTGGELRFQPGRQGQAVFLNADLRLPTAGNLGTAAGTAAVWVKLTPGDPPGPRYLLCVYGDPAGPESWHHSRFSLSLDQQALHFGVYDSAGRLTDLAAPLAGWDAAAWHLVAATWSGLDGAAGQAALRLYLDGRPVAEKAGLTLAVGPVSPTLDIGRDSDASPDYTAGLLDDLYLYDQALPAETIAAAFAAAPNAAAAVTTSPKRLPGWAADRPFRARAVLPAERGERTQLTARLPLGFAGATAQLAGRASSLEPSSLVVYSAGGAQPLPARIEADSLLWAVPGSVPAGAEPAFEVYYSIAGYDVSLPLQAVLQTHPWPPPQADVPLPDYATVTYDDAWDFDEGDDEALDQWGNAADLIRDRSVHDGTIHFAVKEDPFFIWGNMWGQVTASKRPVDIDFERYNVLEIRLKQSVPACDWSIFARKAGSDQLMTCDFSVSGTTWQTVRVDLHGEARFRGHATAFRIDPTNKVEATVEIDYVRLLALAAARCERLEMLPQPSSPPAALALQAPARGEVGSAQPVVVSVKDAAGKPVSGQVVTARLEGDGTLAEAAGRPSYGPAATERSGVTGPDGTLHVELHVSPRAGRTGRLTATAAGTPLTAAAATASLPGAPAKLVVEPARPLFLAPGAAATPVTVRVADSFGNPLPVAGRNVTLAVPAGASIAPAAGVTADDGSLKATLALDPGKLWVAQVTAKETQGLSGTSGAVCYTPAKRDWSVTCGANGWFVKPDGKAWLPLGGFYANWVADVPENGEAGRRLKSFVDASDAEKTAWLRFLSQQGVTAMRFMLRAHRPGGMEPLDIGGRVNPELYAEILHYLDLARPFGIRFLLVIHEDYTKPMYYDADARQRFCLPRWEGLDQSKLIPAQRRFVTEGRLLDDIAEKYTDPDALACQDQYAREIVALLKDNPQVFAWELENEMVAVPKAWVNHACEVIRSVDPRVPICMSHGGGGVHTGDPYYWRTQSTVDIYTYHLYPRGTTSAEVAYGLLTDVLTSYGRMAGQCMLGECTGDEFADGCPEADRRRMARDLVWFSLVNGNPGCFFWNNRGFEVNEFALARKITDGIDFSTWQNRPASVGIDVSHPQDDDTWYRTREGGAAMLAMARYAQHYRRLGVSFDFVWGKPAGRAATPLEPFAPPEGQAAVAPSDGFEAATLQRADGSEGLTYVRNVAGVFEWISEREKLRQMWLRQVGSRPLTLQLDLGAGQFDVMLTDLVSGKETRATVAGDGKVEVGVTEADFAVRWRRK